MRRMARQAICVLIAGAGILVLQASAPARIVRFPAGQDAKTGGERVKRWVAPVTMSCLPWGIGISERYGSAHLEVSPQSATGWLAEPGQNRSILVPYGDGLAACSLATVQDDSFVRSVSARNLAVITSRQAAAVSARRFNQPHVIVHGTLQWFGHRIPVPGWWWRFFSGWGVRQTTPFF